MRRKSRGRTGLGAKERAWVMNAIALAERCVLAGDRLFSLAEDGPHGLSPLNLPLPLILDLVAPYMKVRAALSCDHCREALGLDQKDGPGATAASGLAFSIGAAFFSALQAIAEEGDEDDEGDENDEGTLAVWVPDSAVEDLTRARKRCATDKALAELEGDAQLFAAIVHEPWFARLVDNFYRSLLLEAGMRLTRFFDSTKALQSLTPLWPEYCIHAAIERGLESPPERIESTLLTEAFDEALLVVAAYLKEHSEDPELRLPSFDTLH